MVNDQQNQEKEANKHTGEGVNDKEKNVAGDPDNENTSQLDSDTSEIQENESGKDLGAEFRIMEDKYLRLYADFENYKRRTQNERMELFRTANQEVLVSLLPVLDDFERAMKSMQSSADVKSLKEGVDLVSNKLKTILVSKGLKPMETAGKDFDADFHEAITKVPAPSDDLKGKVIDEVEKGYFLGDKVIRYAKVVVGE